ncbi:MAG TPA: M14 family metallopeptidase [Thermoanaerobaculia bacterium]|nr:M14 family metallopeptidase [Thermoanaerobaculia bacterium]
MRADLRRFVVLTLAALFTATGLLARDPLVVGSAAAGAGQKVSGWIDVPRGTDEGTKIPVTVAHGAKGGPVLALIAGTHGYEYTAILALHRVAAALHPARMSGSVILVHMANPTTFYGRRVYYGPDGKNLNRMYPGDRSGTISERIAHAITTHVIDQSTHVIDMHCGDGNESLRPYSYWMPIGDEKVDGPARDMVLAYGLDHIVIDRTPPADPKKPLYTSTTAMVRGKPAITTESGAMGLTDEASIEAHVAGALSVVDHLQIMDAPSVRVTHPVWYEKTEVLRAPVTGIWRPAVDRMHTVAKGALVGRILDPFANVLREIRAPFAGEILYVLGTPPVTAGEPLAMVAAPALEDRP